MKTPEEIFNEMSVGLQTATRWISIIEQVQIEAWNEAIKTASEQARVKSTYDPDNFQKGGYYIVDVDSILRLKK